MKDRLIELDALRYSDPESAYQELLDSVESVPPDLVPLWCGVVGSCLRHLNRNGEAKDLFFEGIERADARLDHASAGDLYQRLSMVSLHEMEFETALSQNERAITRHLEAGNTQGYAKGLVDRGSILGHMEQIDWSTESYSLALDLLAENETRHRYSAHIGCAVNLLKKDRPSRATYHLDAAATLDPDPVHFGKLLWAAGRAAGSEGTLVRAVDLLAQVAPQDSLIATIDLLSLLHDQGHITRAHSVASALSKRVGALRRDRVAQLVAIELANVGTRGKGLTRAALESALARVSRKNT